MTGWQACCVTLIFRALQRLQPVLDFLWERRGGILGLGWLSGAVGGLAKFVVGGCYRDGAGIARLPGRGGGGAGRRREGVDGLRRWRWMSRCVVQYVKVSRWGIRKRKGGRCWVWGSSMLLWKTVFGSAVWRSSVCIDNLTTRLGQVDQRVVSTQSAFQDPDWPGKMSPYTVPALGCGPVL